MKDRKALLQSSVAIFRLACACSSLSPRGDATRTPPWAMIIFQNYTEGSLSSALSSLNWQGYFVFEILSFCAQLSILRLSIVVFSCGDVGGI